MYYTNYDITFREVPDQSSLTFQIAGCGNKCPNCHSPELQDETNGTLLDIELYHRYLDAYSKFVDSIVFLGGDWDPEIVTFANIAKKTYGIQTCVYSGETNVSDNIWNIFDFVKIGPYIDELGGLDSSTTNQRFYKIEDGKRIDITYKFKKGE